MAIDLFKFSRKPTGTMYLITEEAMIKHTIVLRKWVDTIWTEERQTDEGDNDHRDWGDMFYGFLRGHGVSHEDAESLERKLVGCWSYV